MKKITFTLSLIFIFICFNIKSQITTNKLDVSLGYAYSIPSGDKMINQDGFISPSLYNNFSNIIGYELNITRKGRKHMSYGISGIYSTANSWKLNNYKDYQDCEFKDYLVHPYLQIHTKNNIYKYTNKLKAFVNIGPVIGSSQLNGPSDILYSTITTTSSLKYNDITYGIKTSAGLEFSFTDYARLYFKYSYSMNKRKQHFSTDIINFKQIFSGGIIIPLLFERQLYNQ